MTKTSWKCCHHYLVVYLKPMSLSARQSSISIRFVFHIRKFNFSVKKATSRLRLGEQVSSNRPSRLARTVSHLAYSWPSVSNQSWVAAAASVPALLQLSQYRWSWRWSSETLLSTLSPLSTIVIDTGVRCLCMCFKLFLVTEKHGNNNKKLRQLVAQPMAGVNILRANGMVSQYPSTINNQRQ